MPSEKKFIQESKETDIVSGGLFHQRGADVLKNLEQSIVKYGVFDSLVSNYLHVTMNLISKVLFI